MKSECSLARLRGWLAVSNPRHARSGYGRHLLRVLGACPKMRSDLWNRARTIGGRIDVIERVLRENVNAQANRLEFFLVLLDRMFPEMGVRPGASTRHTVLLASVLRMKQTGRAIQVLSREGCVEEIQGLGRTLIEMTVNAVYLQHAKSSELEGFLRFEPDPRAQMAIPDGSSRKPGWMRRLGEFASRAGLGTGEHGHASWTCLSVMRRAELADQASRVPVLVSLVSRCYGRGHAAIHGTVSSLASFIRSVNAIEPLRPDDRLALLNEALFTVNLCLLSLCVYLNNTFRMGMEHAIDEAANAEGKTRPSLQGVQS